MKKSILLIQPENPRIHAFRRGQLNNFAQLTIPYLAGYINEEQYHITLVDEYSQKVPLHKPFDLVCMTVNTPNAPHCYEMSRKFRLAGAKVALGGPHVTLLPEEAAPPLRLCNGGGRRDYMAPVFAGFLLWRRAEPI